MPPPGFFLMPVLLFRSSTLGLRGLSPTSSTTSKTSSTSPGVVNMLPHLGHLTFLPSGTGLAGLRTDLQSGQVMWCGVVAMIKRPADLSRVGRPRSRAEWDFPCPCYLMIPASARQYIRPADRARAGPPVAALSNRPPARPRAAPPMTLTSSTACPPGRRTRSYSRSMAAYRGPTASGLPSCLPNGGLETMRSTSAEPSGRRVASQRASSDGTEAAQVHRGGADGAEIEIAAPYRRATRREFPSPQPGARPESCRRRTSDRGRRDAGGSPPGGSSPPRRSAAATPADVPACRCDAAWCDRTGAGRRPPSPRRWSARTRRRRSPRPAANSPAASPPAPAPMPCGRRGADSRACLPSGRRGDSVGRPFGLGRIV